MPNYLVNFLFALILYFAKVYWYDWKCKRFIGRGRAKMWETAFAIVCFGILILNLGYCLFDNEH